MLNGSKRFVFFVVCIYFWSFDGVHMLSENLFIFHVFYILDYEEMGSSSSKRNTPGSSRCKWFCESLKFQTLNSYVSITSQTIFSHNLNSFNLDCDIMTMMTSWQWWPRYVENYSLCQWVVLMSASKKLVLFQQVTKGWREC